MTIVQPVCILLLLLFLPRGMMLLAKRPIFRSLGTVFLCYAAGFLLSFVFSDTGIAVTVSEVCIPLAIPLILFSCNLKVLHLTAKPMLGSFSLNLVAVLVIATAGFFLFRNSLPHADTLAAMLTGLYTGGTPNLMAIGMALELPQSEIVLANTADLIAGAFYFLLTLTLFRKLLPKFLPAYRPRLQAAAAEEAEGLVQGYLPKQPESRLQWKRLLPVFGLAVLILALSCGTALLLTGELHVAVVMLGVTTLGVAASCWKPVNRCPGTYRCGQYLIYIFSLAIGMSFDLSAVNLQSLNLLLMLLFVQFGTVALHFFLCWLVRIDAHTALITSVAGIFGPAFVPAASAALENDEITLPGLACGVLGYGIGNYVGIGFAFLLGLFF